MTNSKNMCIACMMGFRWVNGWGFVLSPYGVFNLCKMHFDIEKKLIQSDIKSKGS